MKGNDVTEQILVTMGWVKVMVVAMIKIDDETKARTVGADLVTTLIAKGLIETTKTNLTKEKVAACLAGVMTPTTTLKRMGSCKKKQVLV